MIVFRNCDRRYPFLWETSTQPAGRWHGDGEGPVQYLADTPNGAWAEFLRHEEIVDEADIQGVSRALWAVSLEDTDLASSGLPDSVTLGGLTSYEECRNEARRLRNAGAAAMKVASAALKKGGAAGWRVELGWQKGAEADGEVYVLFGTRPNAVGWCVVDSGRPPLEILPLVRPL